MIERNAEPPAELIDTNMMPWSSAKETWEKKMMVELFDNDNEKKELDTMYHSFLPQTVESVVEGILVPWTKPGEKDSVLGIWFEGKDGRACISDVRNNYADLLPGDVLVKVNGTSVVLCRRPNVPIITQQHSRRSDGRVEDSLPLT